MNAAQATMQIDCARSGDGPPLLLVHSSASGNRQWGKLTTSLQGRYRVIAPQLRGYGGTSAWPGTRRQTLDDAAQVLLELCEQLEGRLRIVGHSYGGAVALWAARKLGRRVSHLVLYEPMLPGLLAPHGHPAAAEASALYADVQRHGAAGDWLALAERFTDYFNGDGSWAASPPARRAAIAAALPPNVHEWHAVMVGLPPDTFAGIAARCLLMSGTHTRPVMRATAELLAQQHPHWQFELMPGCGHMAPLTHAEAFNQRVAGFLEGSAAERPKATSVEA